MSQEVGLLEPSALLQSDRGVHLLGERSGLGCEVWFSGRNWVDTRFASLFPEGNAACSLDAGWGLMFAPLCSMTPTPTPPLGSASHSLAAWGSQWPWASALLPKLATVFT